VYGCHPSVCPFRIKPSDERKVDNDLQVEK
jgi:hypothetical protein